MWLVGAFLLPITAATACTLVRLIVSMHTGPITGWSLENLSLLWGFLFWIFFWCAMPRPIRTYVLGHELTHALWGVVLGAKLTQIKVGKKGGQVTLTRSNVLITLAPYFFPFYTVLVVVAFEICSIFFDPGPYTPFWMALIGFTWGFHFTFTFSTLATHQSDIETYGRLFSYTLILWLNLLGLCIWVIAIGEPRLEDLEAGIREYLQAWGSSLHHAIQAWFDTYWNR